MPEQKIPGSIPDNTNEMTDIWQRVRDGDDEARDRLVMDNMQLVFWVARRFLGRGPEWEDLCQIGAIGLLKAVMNFRPEYNNRFSTYAVPMIMGEIQRALRDDSVIHVSRSCKERIVHVTAARQAFIEEHGREATISELAQSLGMTESQVVLALEANMRPVSLQAPLDADDAGGRSLGDTVPSEESEDGWVSAMLLREGLVRLPARLRFILEARYFREQTQTQIAASLGISQVQVSRLEKQALRLLREYWQPEQRA